MMIVPLIYTYISAFGDENFWREGLNSMDNHLLLLLLKSVFIAFAVAFLSTIVGLLLGFILYRTGGIYVSLLKLLLLIPLFTSPYIQAVAWKDFFFLFGLNGHWIHSIAGVIFITSLVFVPLSMLIIGSALNNIHSALEESALLLIDVPAMFRKILFPLIKPALLTSFVLVFIFSISEFSVPAFLGVKVFTTEIFTRFSAFYDHSLAIFHSVFLVLICFAMLFAERKYISDAPFLSLGKKGSQIRIYDNAGFSGFLIWTYVLISVFVPLLVLFYQSFDEGGEYFIEAFHYLLPTFSSSVFLSLGGAVISVLVGFVAAYFSVRYRYHLLSRILLVIFTIPTIIYGISLIIFYNRGFLSFIYSGFGIIWIGYAGKFSFISAKIIANAMKQIPSSLEEAARISGIGSFSLFTKIILPVLSPAIVASFLISFIFNIGELGLTIMLYPPGTEIMPIKVFTIMANAPQGLTSSMTLIVFLVSLLLVLIFFFLLKRFWTRKTI